MARRDEDADASGEGTSWLVLRHSQAEGLGLLGNALRERGIHHRALDLARGEPVPKDLRGLGGLIVLGGPMAAYEQDKYPFLRSEIALVEKAVAAGRPVLGICLGAQIIAQVLGARVYSGEKPEVGWAPVTHRQPGRSALRRRRHESHGLPPPRRHVRAARRRREPPATSPVYEQQAFRWGEIIYGFQFHLEFTESIIARLAQEPDSQRFMTEAGADLKSILAEAPNHVRALTDTAQRVFENYFAQCGL
jgi:GMP synthase (glutamine-hydrolysing)